MGPLDLHVAIMNSSTTIDRSYFDIDVSGGRLVLHAHGDWTLDTIAQIDGPLKSALNATDYSHVTFEVEKISQLDTAGAFILARAIRGREGTSFAWSTLNASESENTLIKEAASAAMGMAPRQTRPWYDAISRLGKGTLGAWSEVVDTIAFLGRIVLALFNMARRPGRVRWKAVVSLIEQVGLDALPIVMVLSFFIGSVIAFMGAQLLATFGVQIFMVDLVGLAVLREFGVLIMAIMMAARSNSAFTAQIGSMVMRQEVDAMKVIGLNVDETLVAPRALACLVSAPILTFAGMISGLIGGAVVARFVEDISFNAFFVRIAEEIPIDHFVVGMSKAPVFALVIALIGCRQGLAVRSSVESLGQRTTASVVQAIFAVIVLDAVFAMFYLQVGY